MRPLCASAGDGSRISRATASGRRDERGTFVASRASRTDPPGGARISDSLILRGLLGAVLAGAVASTAHRAGSLTPLGQWAAFLLGTLAAVAGWPWAALLIAYFAASSALTRMGREAKAARTVSVLPDASERNAMQVFANGGVYVVLVVAGTLLHAPVLHLMGVGALAASAADTWATEIGTLWGGAPRSILTFAELEAGVSGGITPIGTLASAVAAGLVALAGGLLLGQDAGPWGPETRALLVAGLAGSLGDSLLGATIQSKRWCEQCRTWTERRVHTCQYRTQHRRGIRWVTNDAVNLLATVVGALTALAMVGLTS